MLKKILELAKRRNFFVSNYTEIGGLVSSFDLGPLGTLLQENIHIEWLYSNVVNTDINVYYYKHQEPLKSYNDKAFDLMKVLKTTKAKLPLGVAETVVLQGNKTNKEDDPKLVFYPDTNTVLRFSLLLPQSEAMQYFLHWQRQRKSWWSKITTSPGLFTLGDIASDVATTSVDILAQFPWGNQTSETVSLTVLDQEKVQHGRKLVTPAKVTSSLSMECATVNLLCDATIDTIDKDPVVKFHRKMAPYKCSFAVSSNDSASRNDLSQLAQHVNKQLRRAGISTRMPHTDKLSLESQFQINNECGVPYTIVLSDNTLRTGLLSLLSRDTRLKEQLHLADLTGYMQALLKNF